MGITFLLLLLPPLRRWGGSLSCPVLSSVSAAASSSFQSFFEEETVVSVEFQIFNSNGKLTVLMKNVDSERCPLRTIKMRASKGGLVILNEYLLVCATVEPACNLNVWPMKIAHTSGLTL